MSTSRTPATLMLLPDLPVAAAWRRAAEQHQPVIAVRIVTGPRARQIPEPDSDDVLTVARPRRRAARFRRAANTRLDTRALVDLVDQLRSEGHEITMVHGHFASASSGLPGLLARRGIPYVVSEHSSALTFDNPEKSITRPGAKTARAVYAGATAVLPVAESLGRAMIERGLVDDDKVSVIPNPVDTDVFRPLSSRSDRHRIVTVARLVEVKRLDLMIHALTRLDDEVGLDIIGSGPERNALGHLVARFGLERRVSFLGQRDQADVADTLRAARVFALSSFTENLPVAALEALACGLPVVAPAVGGLPELLADTPGETYPSGDVAAMASALERWLSADGNVTDDARQVAVSRYSIDAVGAKLSPIYESVTERPTDTVLT